MTRLLVHVEGQTEEDFVKFVLADHLYRFGYFQVSARLMGNARQRARRGGVRGWPKVRTDILNHLKADPGCLATTMVDYYGLPRTGSKAWPGRSQVGGEMERGDPGVVENAMLEDVMARLPDDSDQSRFVPFVTMHEFEALLFSDPQRFADEIGHSRLGERFQQIRDEFPTPEDIDDSPDTAPSTRVRTLVPGYQKPLMGVVAALGVGLATMRMECPHFREWLERLESLPRVARSR